MVCTTPTLKMDRYFTGPLLHEHACLTATSAFLRASGLNKPSSQRSIAPHVFERKEEVGSTLATLGY